jgi:hypothetical protein
LGLSGALVPNLFLEVAVSLDIDLRLLLAVDVAESWGNPAALLLGAMSRL